MGIEFGQDPANRPDRHPSRDPEKGRFSQRERAFPFCTGNEQPNQVDEPARDQQYGDPKERRKRSIHIRAIGYRRHICHVDPLTRL